ncbi:effector-associated domain EAD1-containing protein [Aulosira sp. FACHB-615]|uniref:effector-associated domain EAD1-containing protein n=1 Tax=Aulosira sp. FACHB-615 TaxID=2692777 RepID=UPI001688556E|nr:effector-associated domain EAD1-containing protein [Aulosira sp. FACHB-615]MBD2491694.1 hypothetical protein [Aulosira sp. FACHB-615]
MLNSSTGKNVRLTIIHLDLVKSSTYTNPIERNGGVELTPHFILQIKNLVKESFDLVTKNSNSEYEEIQPLGGDAYRVSFQEVNDAHQFVEYFCKLVKEKDNQEPNKRKRIFRIGAATGNVIFNSSESGLDRIIGDNVLVTVSRLIGIDKAGYFYVDKETFNSLPEAAKTKFIPEVIMGKPHDNDPNIQCYSCQIFQDINELKEINKQNKETLPKELSTKERRDFREVIKSAFPNLKDLQRILDENECNNWLRNVNANQDDDNFLYDLIKKIESDGNTSIFLEILYQAKPNNSTLKNFYNRYNKQ